MAGIRKGKCYREIQRAYTRKSKFRNKAYIKSVPTHKIIRFVMGDPNKKYNTNIEIVCLEDIQLRHNAIESARQVINRRLNKHIGATNYLYEIRMYPHHILRENKMLTGAGSDRMQTGMQRAFGRTVGSAAQVKRNKTMMKISFDKKGRTFVIDAIKVGFSKLPCRYKLMESSS